MKVFLRSFSRSPLKVTLPSRYISTVPLNLIKELREKTRAGYGDCREALVNSDGDVKKAQDWLREKGLMKAAARAGRATHEGLVGLRVGKLGTTFRGVTFELTAETDSVARSDTFRQLAASLTEGVWKSSLSDSLHSSDSLRPLKLSDGKTIEETVGEAAGVLGEALKPHRAVILSSSGALGSYVHQNEIVG